MPKDRFIDSLDQLKFVVFLAGTVFRSFKGGRTIPQKSKMDWSQKTSNIIREFQSKIAYCILKLSFLWSMEDCKFVPKGPEMQSRQKLFRTAKFFYFTFPPINIAILQH